MILLIIILFLTVTEAVHEGLKQRGKSEIAGVVEAVKLLGILAMIPFLIWYAPHYYAYFNQPWKFWSIFVPKYFIGWVVIRLGIFDYMYNLAAKNPVLYVGDTKLSDKYFMKRFFNLAGPQMYVWFKFVALVLGIGLILGI